MSVINLPVFDVRVYGAEGDGLTNDTAAIQAAVAAATSASGGVILFPGPGTYLQTSSGVHTIPADTAVIGTNGAIVQKTIAGNWFEIDGDNTLIEGLTFLNDPNTMTTSNPLLQINAGVSHVTIRDSAFKGKASAGSATTVGIVALATTDGSDIVTTNAASDILIENCRFDDLVSGIDVRHNPQRWTIKDCVFTNIQTRGIYYRSLTHKVTPGNEFGDWLISGCRMHTFGTTSILHGMQIQLVAADCLYTDLTSYKGRNVAVRDCVIEGNYVEHLDAEPYGGIGEIYRFVGIKNLVVTGNYALGGGDGFFNVTNIDGLIFEDNVGDVTAGFGLWIGDDTTNAVVRNNVFRNWARGNYEYSSTHTPGVWSDALDTLSATAVTASTNQVTLSAGTSVVSTGRPFYFVGTAPSDFTPGTVYWMTQITSSTFTVHESLASVVGGIVIDITSDSTTGWTIQPLIRRAGIEFDEDVRPGPNIIVENNHFVYDDDAGYEPILAIDPGFFDSSDNYVAPDPTWRVSQNMASGLGNHPDDIWGLKQQEDSTGVFNVRDYGAVGDGTTDDTAAIQSAVAAWVAAGTGTLFFPPVPGGYSVDLDSSDAMFNVTSITGGVIQGSGWSSRLIRASADGTKWWQFNACDDLTVRDMVTINDSGSSNLHSSFTFYECRRIRFTDNDVWYGQQNGLQFLGFARGDTNYSETSTNEYVITNNRFYLIDKAVVLFTASKRGIVTSNLFSQCAYGVFIDDRSSDETFTSGFHPSDHLVDGNTFYRCGWDQGEAAIFLTANKGTIISNNLVIEQGADSDTLGVDTGSIVNTYGFDVGSSASTQSENGSHDVVIQGNRILRGSGPGIHLSGLNVDPVVSGNTITDPYYGRGAVSNSSGVLLTATEMAPGPYWEGPTRAVIRGNVFIRQSGSADMDYAVRIDDPQVDDTLICDNVLSGVSNVLSDGGTGTVGRNNTLSGPTVTGVNPNSALTNLLTQLDALGLITNDVSTTLYSGPFLPTPSSTYRGQIYTVEGETNVADRSYICNKLSDNTYTWIELPQ